MAAKELRTYLETGNIVNSVNLPNASMPRSGKTRVCVIHKNIPAMLSKISTSFSDAGVNIENMLNQSKKDVAYTMIDTDGEVTTDILNALKALEGVIKIRVI